MEINPSDVNPVPRPWCMHHGNGMLAWEQKTGVHGFVQGKGTKRNVMGKIGEARGEATRDPVDPKQRG